MLTVIQNDAFVPIGVYGDYLAACGIPFRLLNAFSGDTLPAPESCRGVIILGGSMGVNDTAQYPFLDDLKAFISGCLKQKTFFLGICLGGQLLAQVLGAKVSSGVHPERGMLPIYLTPQGTLDPLFSSTSNPFLSFQWHNDSFELPPGAHSLAVSPLCPCQAYRSGNAWGVQFHPEVDSSIISSWCSELSGDPPIPEQEAAALLGDFDARYPVYADESRIILDNFLLIAGIR